MGFPCPSADVRSNERFFSRHPRLARALATGLAVTALWGAGTGPALAAVPSDPGVAVQSTPDAPSLNPTTAVPAPGQLPELLGIPPTLFQTGTFPVAPLPAIAPPDAGIIAAPYYSQFDGSIWADSNCGPTALAMALGALGIQVDQLTLRHLANLQMGIANPDIGTTWESLAAAARAYNVAVQGLYSSGKQPHNWTIDDLKAQLSQGHPVLLLVHYPELPGHSGSSFRGDHYVVALGFDAHGNLVYNDPATRGGTNGTVTVPASQILAAWSDTTVGLVRTAMAVAK